jgi:hypothetical protein
MAGDWQPYNGPEGGRGWKKPGGKPDGGDLIVYTNSNRAPGSTPKAPQAPSPHAGGNRHGGFSAHAGGSSGEREHHSVGAHRLVSALRLAGRLINRPHLVNLASISMLIRLLGGMSVGQLQHARGDLGRWERSPSHSLALRERAHLGSLSRLVNVGG